jgi:hypothetical protein
LQRGVTVIPAIRPAWRKCLVLSFYFLDREFGFCHARVQTWFPFTIQVYVNGHEWLAHGAGALLVPLFPAAP